jgi:hypothetical protein
MKKIAVGIPHTGLFHWQTLMSLLSLKIPQGVQIKYHLIGSCLIYDAREKIVEFAIKEECDYVLFLDSDMCPPSDMIIKMLNVLENTDYKIVTGMAFKRTAPFQPCFYTKVAYDTKTLSPILESPVEFPDNGLIELQGMGLACCMIKTDIFKKLEKPYFFPLPNLGEDLTFSLKAKQKKIKMCVDLTLSVEHIATFGVTKEHFRLCYEEHKKKNEDNSLLFSEG